MPEKNTYNLVKCNIESVPNHFLISTEYINNKTKLKILCPNKHIFFITYSDFQSGYRCSECSGNKKKTIEYIKQYALKDGSICLSNNYKNAHSLLKFQCPNGHIYDMKWNTFQQGNRCAECSGIKKHTYEYIKNKFEIENWKLLEFKYTNSSTPMQCMCPNGHKQNKTYSDFQQGIRCADCYFENNRGKNHPNYNPNRHEIPINRILRRPRSKTWIEKHMTHDPNYNDYILNPKNYELDHKIPVKLFCELYTKYNINEIKLKQIINKIDNLQLLTVDENRQKNYKGNLEEATQYLINNGIKIENRNYSNVS